MLPYIHNDNYRMNPEAMRKPPRLNVLRQFYINVVERIFEDGMKHLNPQVKPSLRLRFVPFTMIAFLLVPHELIHVVGGRACLPLGHEAIGSKVIVTFIDPEQSTV